MDLTKKSLGWLKPIVFTEKEAAKFQKSVEKPLSAATLKKQGKLFKVAKNLLERERN
jgi:hypothetical protein